MSEHIKPRTATVVVYQGDDLERLAELDRKVQIAVNSERAASRRLGDETPNPQAAREDYDAFVAEASERAVSFDVRAMPKGPFRELLAAHPPREKNRADAAYGVNVDTFSGAFLKESLVGVGVGAKDLPLADWATVMDALSDGDFDRLFAAAYWLNRAPGADPKELLYSTAQRPIDP